MGRIASFIDNGYLQKLLKSEFGQPKLDFSRVARKLAGTNDILRTYFYDCPPYQSNPPTAEESRRFASKEKFFHSLDAIPRFEVRKGRLELRGYLGNGSPNFVQKRVDILLGVDLALLAAKHQITDAALLAGDSDFLPAVEAAKREGVVIHLFHGARAHKDLVTSCDERTQIDQLWIDDVKQA